MKKQLHVVLLVPLFLVALSCKQNKSEWKGTIEERDGVIIVNNPSEPMFGPDALSLEEGLSIGDNEVDSSYYFSVISDVKVDQEGRIYVLDGMESLLKIFDNQGSYIQTIGREGQGPGELQSPGGVYFSPKNEIVLKDQKGLNYFSKEGSFITHFPQVEITFFLIFHPLRQTLPNSNLS